MNEIESGYGRMTFAVPKFHEPLFLPENWAWDGSPRTKNDSFGFFAFGMIMGSSI